MNHEFVDGRKLPYFRLSLMHFDKFTCLTIDIILVIFLLHLLPMKEKCLCEWIFKVDIVSRDNYNNLIV